MDGLKMSEYQISSEVQRNLDELDRRYRRYQLFVIGRFALAFLGIIVSIWLWMVL